MSRYRKRPVEIEAIQLRWDTWNEICEFAPVGTAGCRGVYVSPDSETWDDKDLWGAERVRLGLVIPTLEGTMLAVENDWIIRGVQGEFYPCKPDIFELTYEEVQ